MRVNRSRPLLMPPTVRARHTRPPQIRGTGYGVDSLEAALWAFQRSQDFREGALLAVNLGEDADTTGAVYGQLAGAFYGEDGLPAAWLKRLTQREFIGELAEKLYTQGAA